jgi:hypothetical protein
MFVSPRFWSASLGGEEGGKYTFKRREVIILFSAEFSHL